MGIEVFLLCLLFSTVAQSQTDIFNLTQSNSQNDTIKDSYEYPALVASVNRSVNPCDNFYAFVCDGWIQKHPIPETRKEVNQMGLLSEEILSELTIIIKNTTIGHNRELSLARIHFDKCLENTNKTTNEGIEAMLKKLQWMRQNILFLTDWLIEMSPEVAVYDVMVAPDEYNSTTNIITLSPTPTMLSYASYFDPAYAEEYVATRKSLFDFLTMLSKDDEMKNVIDYSPRGIRHRVENFFTVDRNLAKIQEIAKSQPGAMSIPLIELTRHLPSVDWLRYFAAIFPQEIVPSLPYKFVSLRDAYVIFKIEEMVARMPPRWFIDYLEWKVMFRYIPYFPNEYESIIENYDKKMYGITGREPERGCVTQTIERFADVLSTVWVHKNFDNSSIPRVMSMVETVQGSFLDLLYQNTWMDEQTKQKARLKANAIRPFIGYDPMFISPDKVKEKYQLINFNNETSFFNIIKNLEKFNYMRNLEMLKKENKRETFEAFPIEANAFYDPSQNQIAVLAGILREPFYNASWPEMLNYAAIGMVIGHEITHGFDNEGSTYDEVGNRVEWWAPQTREEFNKKKDCIKQQYGQTTVVNGVNIDGQRTLGENIADNGGMRTIIKTAEKMNKNFKIAGLEDYTADQIFFMSYGMTWCSNQRPFTVLNDLATESHSPPKYRVNTVLENQPEFAATFNCPVGSPMNPTNKCTVW